MTDLQKTQTAYAYFTLREWNIIHTALNDLHSAEYPYVIGDKLLSHAELYSLLCKLPSASMDNL